MDRLTPSEAAKAQCQECLGLNQFNRNEIQNCKGDTCYAGPCPLFPLSTRSAGTRKSLPAILPSVHGRERQPCPGVRNCNLSSASLPYGEESGQGRTRKGRRAHAQDAPQSAS